MSNIYFDKDLIKKCQTNAPRYTSYPTADRFHMEYNIVSQIDNLAVFARQSQAISLYIHIPFCNTLCLYCGCNKIITNDKSKITKYIDYLEKEIQLYAKIIGKKLPVLQLHFGGGSPSWMSIDEVNRIMQIVNKYFDLGSANEIAMELDPRHVSREFVANLYEQGFNRISIGVQDLDPKVQKAVNRVQPIEDTMLVLDEANRLGFTSTSIDLIYGLPFQTIAGFSRTIDLVIEEIKPARIALFNYAHIPSLFFAQTRIKEYDLPGADVKLDILQLSMDKLTSAGYVFIGMDHFARPDDELAIALQHNTLQRNFQGYSTHADTDMLSFGVSSIGYINNSYYQNVKDIDSYYNLLDNQQLPILRGISLTPDDLVRKAVIGDIMCQFSLDYAKIAREFGVEFTQYFAPELLKLEELEKLEMIVLLEYGFRVTDKGRLLIRNIAVVFDYYFNNKQKSAFYSKVI